MIVRRSPSRHWQPPILSDQAIMDCANGDQVIGSSFYFQISHLWMDVALWWYKWTGWYLWQEAFFKLSRREFLSFNFVFRDENANFFLSISGFETRMRIEIKTILARFFKNAVFACFWTDIFHFCVLIWLIFWK